MTFVKQVIFTSLYRASDRVWKNSWNCIWFWRKIVQDKTFGLSLLIKANIEFFLHVSFTITLQTSNVRQVCLITKPCGNICDLLFANNWHKPPMKNRIRSTLVPSMAQAVQECLVVCVTNLQVVQVWTWGIYYLQSKLPQNSLKILQKS